MQCKHKRSYRHCPDTIAIKHHFSQHSDMELNITERDSICTNCYSLSFVHKKSVQPEATPSMVNVDEESKQWEKCCSNLNERVQKQVKRLTDQDAAIPYDISKFNLDETISSIDPFLWKSIVHITRMGVKEGQDISHESRSQQRKLNCLYCLCVILFSHNKCCSVPSHLLLTDLIDSQGGSWTCS